MNMPRAQARELFVSGLVKKKPNPLNRAKTLGKTHFWAGQKIPFTRFSRYAQKPLENDTFPLAAGHQRR